MAEVAQLTSKQKAKIFKEEHGVNPNKYAIQHMDLSLNKWFVRFHGLNADPDKAAEKLAKRGEKLSGKKASRKLRRSGESLDIASALATSELRQAELLAKSSSSYKNSGELYLAATKSKESARLYAKQGKFDLASEQNAISSKLFIQLADLLKESSPGEAGKMRREGEEQARLASENKQKAAGAKNQA